MKIEDKELLLKDLCARLPYGTIGIYEATGWTDEKATLSPNIYNNVIEGWKFTPYLFPLSSMNEEQKAELENLGWNFDNFEIHNVSECFGTYREYVAHLDCFVLIDWLNKNNFDYRGLIEKELAIDATNLNIY